jgi:HAD superfamily hydrolase (TIGR01509 family)
VSLKALFFDFGGTLDIYPDVHEESVAAAGKMLDLLASAGLDLNKRYSNEEFYHFVRDRNSEYKKWKNETLIELPEKKVWKDYILSGEPRKELLDCNTVREITYLMDNGFHSRSVRPEAKEALENLGQYGLAMGIISNVLSSVQVPRDLKRYGIDEFFDPVITSADFGRIKPHSSIFMHAVEAAGLEADECVYIGNSPLNDIQGAKDAGFMAAVLIRYEHTPLRDSMTEAKPDYYIENLLELTAIVEKLLESSRLTNSLRRA